MEMFRRFTEFSRGVLQVNHSPPKKYDTNITIFTTNIYRHQTR